MTIECLVRQCKIYNLAVGHGGNFTRYDMRFLDSITQHTVRHAFELLIVYSLWPQSNYFMTSSVF